MSSFISASQVFTDFRLKKTISLSKYIIVTGNPVQNTQWRHKAYLLPLEPVLRHENYFSSVLMLYRVSTDPTGRGLGVCLLFSASCKSWAAAPGWLAVSQAFLWWPPQIWQLAGMAHRTHWNTSLSLTGLLQRSQLRNGQTEKVRRARYWPMWCFCALLGTPPSHCFPEPRAFWILSRVFAAFCSISIFPLPSLV